MDITIVIPTYNEAGNLPELVRRIRSGVKNARILIMDDSPNDQTAEVAKELKCTVIRRKGDRGLAPAVIDGFKLSMKCKKVVMCDADLQHPPEVIPDILRELDTHDLVIASRYINGGSESFTPFRKVVSRVANILAMPLVPQVKDRMTGFCGFNPKILDGVELNRQSWKLPLDIMAKAKYKTVTEVPYAFGNRHSGESKLNNKIIMEYLKQLAGLYWYKIRG